MGKFLPQKEEYGVGYIEQVTPNIYTVDKKDIPKREFAITCVYDAESRETKITQHSSKTFIYKYIVAYGNNYGFLHYTQKSKQNKAKKKVKEKAKKRANKKAKAKCNCLESHS